MVTEEEEVEEGEVSVVTEEAVVVEEVEEEEASAVTEEAVVVEEVEEEVVPGVVEEVSALFYHFPKFSYIFSFFACFSLPRSVN